MSHITTEPHVPSREESSSWMADGVSQWGLQGLVFPAWHILHTNWSIHFLQSPSNPLKPKVSFGDHIPQHMVRRCYSPCPRCLLVQPSSWPHSVWCLHPGSASRNTTSTLQAYLFPLCSPIIEVPYVESKGWANTREGISARLWAESSWLSLCSSDCTSLFCDVCFLSSNIWGGKEKQQKDQEIAKEHALLVKALFVLPSAEPRHSP